MQQGFDVSLLTLAADERGGLLRQVVGNLLHAHPACVASQHTVDFVGVGRQREAGIKRAHLKQLDRVGNAFQQPVTVRLHFQLVTQTAVRTRLDVVTRLFGQQGLATLRQRHHTRRHRLGQAVDFQWFGTARHVFGTVFTQDDRAHVQACAGFQRHRQRCQSAVVGDGVSHGIGGFFKQQQHAVGFVDFQAAVRWQQIACGTVVVGPHGGHRSVAQRFRQLGAVHHIGQQQRACLHLGGLLGVG